MVKSKGKVTAKLAKFNTPTWLIIHHLGGSTSSPLADTSHHTFEMVNENHRKQKFPKSSLGFYCGYHYFISKTGVVTQARADKDIGAHTIGYNDKSIAITLAGNFDATLPTKAQETTLKRILEALMTKYSIPLQNIVPHRKFAKKSCYGKKLSDTWAQNLLTYNPLELIEDLHRQEMDILKKWYTSPYASNNNNSYRSSSITNNFLNNMKASTVRGLKSYGAFVATPTIGAPIVALVLEILANIFNSPQLSNWAIGLIENMELTLVGSAVLGIIFRGLAGIVNKISEYFQDRSEREGVVVDGEVQFQRGSSITYKESTKI